MPWVLVYQTGAHQSTRISTQHGHTESERRDQRRRRVYRVPGSILYMRHSGSRQERAAGPTRCKRTRTHIFMHADRYIATGAYVHYVVDLHASL